MPLAQYFGWVGSFLLAAQLAASWCFSPISPAPASDVPLNQRINIRIHMEHKWPERVVFDTTRSMLAQKADAESDISESETPVLATRQPFDAFAEMATISARPCSRPSCSTGQAADREASAMEKSAPSHNYSRSSMAARKDLTFPNPLHKPPGKS